MVTPWYVPKYEVLLLPSFIIYHWFCDNGMFLVLILGLEQFLNCRVIGVLMFLESFYREDAIRSVLDLRDPGPATLLFLITPTSSKTSLLLIS